MLNDLIIKLNAALTERMQKKSVAVYVKAKKDESGLDFTFKAPGGIDNVQPLIDNLEEGLETFLKEGTMDKKNIFGKTAFILKDVLSEDSSFTKYLDGTWGKVGAGGGTARVIYNFK